jgi:hypothetical protein
MALKPGDLLRAVLLLATTWLLWLWWLWWKAYYDMPDPALSDEYELEHGVIYRRRDDG